MKRLLIALESVIRGWVALILALVAAGTLVWWIGARLPWRHWPDVFAIVTSSWLYLIIAGAICMTAAQPALRKGSSLTGAVACLLLGLSWHKFSKFIPLPFDLRWVLVTYGLAGVGATCLMRARVKQLLRGHQTIEVPQSGDIKAAQPADQS